MKIIQKVLFFITALLAIVCGFIIICAMKPEVTEAITGFLYPENNPAVTAETEEETENVTEQDNSQAETGEAESTVPENQTEDKQTSGSQETDKQVTGEKTEADGWEDFRKEESPTYVAPSTSSVVVPSKVAGKNGYQQIKYDVEQIGEDAAEKLLSQLDEGDAGDGLDFDADFYPYYAMLDEDEQHLYRQIYANANNLYKTFKPVEAVSAGTLKDVFSAVYNDHPELFWLETAYSCKYKSNGECIAIDLKFNATSQDLGTAKSTFNENAKAIVAEAGKLGDTYAKEKYVHDALIDKVSYNLGAAMNQSAYSALVNGQTVCAGYARAFQYLMQQLEVPCYYCTGYAGESHAWNIIELDDGFYNVDTTWDDTDKGTYDYFNKTDEDYALTHVRQDLSVYLPPCNGTKYRNLESASNEGKRSLADVGIGEEQVIKNLSDYHKNCYNQIVNNGSGTYSFSNVIEGETLLEEINKDYFETSGYIDGYMKSAVLAVNSETWYIYIETEELQNKRYLIKHDVTIR